MRVEAFGAKRKALGLRVGLCNYRLIADEKSKGHR
jgi:hypothetical protein